MAQVYKGLHKPMMRWGIRGSNIVVVIPSMVEAPLLSRLKLDVTLFSLTVMTKIYATLGRKFNKEDLEKAMQANQQLEEDPTVPKSYTCK